MLPSHLLLISHLLHGFSVHVLQCFSFSSNLGKKILTWTCILWRLWLHILNRLLWLWLRDNTLNRLWLRCLHLNWLRLWSHVLSWLGHGDCRLCRPHRHNFVSVLIFLNFWFFTTRTHVKDKIDWSLRTLSWGLHNFRLLCATGRVFGCA